MWPWRRAWRPSGASLLRRDTPPSSHYRYSMRHSCPPWPALHAADPYCMPGVVVGRACCCSHPAPRPNPLHCASPNQEVTPYIQSLFESSSWWPRYQCSSRPQGAPYFTLLLVKRDGAIKVEGSGFVERPFRNSIMGRSLLSAKVCVCGGGGGCWRGMYVLYATGRGEGGGCCQGGAAARGDGRHSRLGSSARAAGSLASCSLVLISHTHALLCR